MSSVVEYWISSEANSNGLIHGQIYELIDRALHTSQHTTIQMNSVIAYRPSKSTSYDEVELGTKNIDQSNWSSLGTLSELQIRSAVFVRRGPKNSLYIMMRESAAECFPAVRRAVVSFTREGEDRKEMLDRLGVRRHLSPQGIGSHDATCSLTGRCVFFSYFCYNLPPFSRPRPRRTYPGSLLVLVHPQPYLFPTSGQSSWVSSQDYLVLTLMQRCFCGQWTTRGQCVDVLIKRRRTL